MEMIKWDARLSVGSDVLDRQHQDIIKIINQLIDQPDEAFGAKPVTKILNDLVYHVRLHFWTEEKILDEKGYDDLKTHKNEHTEYRIEFVSLSFDLIRETKKEPQDLKKFLCRWWKNHILHNDLAYRNILREQEKVTENNINPERFN